MRRILVGFVLAERAEFETGTLATSGDPLDEA